MRRKGIFRDDFHPRACNGKRTLRGYTKNGNPENVVVIDLDDDNHPDVIIIDDPDSSEPREREVPFHKVISIDDEDSEVDHPGVGVPCVGELDSDATSSKRSFPSPEFSGSPLDFDVDQFCTVQKEQSSSKASKCQKSYVGKTPCRNRYGLNPESEDGSSESDCSDCEVLEGSSEELRKQWERTYSKQKGKSFNFRYGIGDQASTSTFHAGAHMNTEECRDDIYFSEPIFSFSTDDKAEENLSCGNDAYPNIWHNEDFTKGESPRPSQQTACFRSQENGQAEFVTVNGNVQVGGEACTNKGPVDDRHENSSGSSVNTHNEDQGTNYSYGWFDIMGGPKENECAGECLEEKDKRNMKASCPSSSQSAYCNDEESDSYRSQVSGEANMSERVFRRECNYSQNEMLHTNVATSYTEEQLWDQLVRKTVSSDGIDTINDGGDKGDIIGMSSTNCNPEVSHEEAQEKPEQFMKRSCSMKEKEPVVESTSKAQSNEKRDRDGSAMVQDSIINGREKLKETDEYRQAQEEEWASRQRQLQLQVLLMILLLSWCLYSLRCRSLIHGLVA